MKNQENKLYQLTCLFSTSTKTEKIDQIITKIKEIITKNEGILSENNYSSAPIKKKLAYLMKKQSEALYWDLNFSLSPEKVSKLNYFLKQKESLIRYIIANRKKIKPKPIKKSASLKMIDKIEPLLNKVPTETIKKEKIKEKIESKNTEDIVEEKGSKAIKEKTKIEDLDKKLEEILNQ